MVRAIRLFAKPPPPWESLVISPRNIARAEITIHATNNFTEFAAAAVDDEC